MIEYLLIFIEIYKSRKTYITKVINDKELINDKDTKIKQFDKI